jgi:hypothetical protein
MKNAMPMDRKEQRIRETAYHLWEEDGRPIGQAERHWEMARKIAEDAERRQPAPAARSDRGQNGKKGSRANSKLSLAR